MENFETGTIYIVDISGYTAFVKQTSNADGAMIVSKLLDTIIQANNLSLKISEIEGDAILFYHVGPAYPIKAILGQFEAMLNAFQSQIKALIPQFPQVKALSIKLVAHYGEIGTFSVGGFSKLYGKALVEAHRLLKNHIGRHTYALITDEYRIQQSATPQKQSGSGHDCCEIYDVGQLCYSYYLYPENTPGYLPKAIA